MKTPCGCVGCAARLQTLFGANMSLDKIAKNIDNNFGSEPVEVGRLCRCLDRVGAQDDSSASISRRLPRGLAMCLSVSDPCLHSSVDFRFSRHDHKRKLQAHTNYLYHISTS